MLTHSRRFTTTTLRPERTRGRSQKTMTPLTPRLAQTRARTCPNGGKADKRCCRRAQSMDPKTIAGHGQSH